MCKKTRFAYTGVFVTLLLALVSAQAGAYGVAVNSPTQPPPTVTSITPDSGNTNTVIHITDLAGGNFQSGATVKLIGVGQPEINATNVVVVSESRITCDIDLRGVSAGHWTVRVTNPDAEYAELADGFTVLWPVYIPLTMRGWPLVPATPVLNPISNPDDDGNYAVSWNAVPLAQTYTLQEDDNPAFSSPETRYSGIATSWSAVNKDVGTYYYRVMATNTYGSSNWSNIESAVVKSEPSGPEPGHYTGTPSVSFDVTVEQKVCSFRMVVPFGSTTCTIRPTCAAIVNDEFGWVWDHDPFNFISTVTGEFNTRTRASGRYKIYMCGNELRFTPSEGTWEATK